MLQKPIFFVEYFQKKKKKYSSLFESKRTQIRFFVFYWNSTEIAPVSSLQLNYQLKTPAEH